MTRTVQHRWLNRFAWMTAACTFLLIALGGLVTSKGAGMAVPDWPTTYGYNMFLFPIRLWTGGIFYEHTHRLFASFVGLLTTGLAVWLWVREPRAWLRWLGVAAFFAVVLQGVLGGLRVTLFKDQIGIVHAALAQIFFVLLVLIGLSSSGMVERLRAASRAQRASWSLRWLTGIGLGLIFTQLILGASMRHQHAGLAVPDFPLAYGQVWPPMDNAFIEQVNRQRLGVQDYKPITAFQIGLHMAHRLNAVLVLLAVGMVAWLARRQQGKASPIAKLGVAWIALICVQALLGAATVWTNKAADMATAHVLAGALSLALGAVFATGVVALGQRKAATAAQGSDFRLLRGGGSLPSINQAAM